MVACALLMSLSSTCWSQVASIAKLTLIDGDMVVIRGATRTVPTAGFALKVGDVLETGKTAHLVRIEFPDQTILDLGPRTSVLLRPPLPSRGASRPPLAYALAGWVKLTAAPGVASSILTPAVEVVPLDSVVLNVLPQDSYVFAELGRATASARGDAQAERIAVDLEVGQFATASDTEPPRVVAQPPGAWLHEVPAGFRDRLARRFDQFGDQDAPVKSSRPVALSDVEPWLRAEPALRRSLRPRWEAFARVVEAAPTMPGDPRVAPGVAAASMVANAPVANAASSTSDAPSVLGAFEVASFASPDRSVQGGLITPMNYAEHEGDARAEPLAVRNGELLVKGAFADKGQSAWAGVGVTVNLPGSAMDASAFKMLRIRLAASSGTRALRVRLLGVDRKLQRSGCYPVFEQAVSARPRVYDIPLSRFAPDEYCGSSGASLQSTMKEFFGIEVADAVRPVEARAVQFSVGSVSLLK